MSPISCELGPGSLGPIRVGASKEEVHAALGAPASAGGRTERWLENALRVDFDEAGRVEFIEVSRDPRFEVRIGGQDPFALTGEALEDLLVPVFGPRVELEEGATWVFPGSQLAVHTPFRPGALSVARPGYHDDSVRGEVRELTVMAVINDAGEDDLALMDADWRAFEVVTGRALAVDRSLGMVAVFAAAGEALRTANEVREALPPAVQMTAGIDRGPTFVGRLVSAERDIILGPAVALSKRLALVRPKEITVSDAARDEAAELGEAFEFPVRSPRVKKGAPPGRLARGHVVRSRSPQAMSPTRQGVPGVDTSDR